jgi:hypothetical protein
VDVKSFSSHGSKNATSNLILPRIRASLLPSK